MEFHEEVNEPSLNSFPFTQLNLMLAYALFILFTHRNRQRKRGAIGASESEKEKVACNYTIFW
jgi:hypothetical protein